MELFSDIFWDPMCLRFVMMHLEKNICASILGFIIDKKDTIGVHFRHGIC